MSRLASARIVGFFHAKVLGHFFWQTVYSAIEDRNTYGLGAYPALITRISRRRRRLDHTCLKLQVEFCPESNIQL